MGVFEKPIARFLVKALGFFVTWYIIYEMWILPDGRVDEWISLNIVGISAGVIDWLGYDIYVVNRIVGIMGYSGVEVIDGCNGISAIGLFLGFIIAYPGDWRARLSFSLMGIAIIYLVNLCRIIFLVITKVEWPGLFEITHDYSTTTIFYLVIFILWVIWVNLDFSTKKISNEVA